jgi:hypothetical protein
VGRSARQRSSHHVLRSSAPHRSATRYGIRLGSGWSQGAHEGGFGHLGVGQGRVLVYYTNLAEGGVITIKRFDKWIKLTYFTTLAVDAAESRLPEAFYVNHYNSLVAKFNSITPPRSLG